MLIYLRKSKSRHLNETSNLLENFIQAILFGGCERTKRTCDSYKVLHCAVSKFTKTNTKFPSMRNLNVKVSNKISIQYNDKTKLLKVTRFNTRS